MPSLHISPPTPEQKQKMDELYSQNLELSKQINQLNNQNTFYQIQIKNFQKLTNSINKDLYQLGINFRKANKNSNDTQINQNNNLILMPQTNLSLQVDSSSKLTPLFTVSNKIKLKNLQMKIGNSIRDAQKLMKRNLEGSVKPLQAASQKLQKQISMIFIKNTQLKAQSSLLKGFQCNSAESGQKDRELMNVRNLIDGEYKKFVEYEDQNKIFDDEFLDEFKISIDFGKQSKLIPDLNKTKHKGLSSNKKSQHIKFSKNIQTTKLSELQKILKQQQKTAQQISKKIQEKQKTLLSLTKANYDLTDYLNKLKTNSNQSNLSAGLSLKQKLKLELEELQRQQQNLQLLIMKQNRELQQQYAMNRQSKQKIADRKYQQTKQLKVLEEQVGKCRDQLKQIKAKCKNKDNISINMKL